MLRSAFSSVLLAGLLLACGGKSFGNAGESEGGSGNGGRSTEAGTSSGARESGGSSAGGMGSGGGSSGGSASGGKASGGSAGAAHCDPSGLEDETSDDVSVRLVNGTQHAIYLGNEMPGCDVALVQVTTATGQPLNQAGTCMPTCEELMNGDAVGCAPILCPAGSVLLLGPGESTITAWSPLYSELVSVPPACQNKTIGVQCERIARARPGTYVFAAQAGSSMKCNAPDSMSCPCEATGVGGCRTYSALIAGPLLQVEAKVELDISYGLGAQGGGPRRQVELTFTD